MEFVNKKVIQSEVVKGHTEDCTSEALEIVNQAVDFIEKNRGKVGGIVLGIRPTRVAKDKHALCCMTGTMLGTGEMLLTAFQELFEKMPTDMIAFFLDEFMDTIPDEKRVAVIGKAADIRKENIINAVEELKRNIEESDNE